MPNDTLAAELNKNGIHVTAAVTIQRDARTLYHAWRGFRELPRLIDQLENVEDAGAGTTRWTVRGPGGVYSWNAHIIRDEPDRTIAWKTDDDADVRHAGSIQFRELPYQRGTEVKVALEFIPKGGKIGDAVAKMLGYSPRDMLQLGLHRFRQAMETGEIATNVGQPTGAGQDDKERTTDADIRDLTAGKRMP